MSVLNTVAALAQSSCDALHVELAATSMNVLGSTVGLNPATERDRDRARAQRIVITSGSREETSPMTSAVVSTAPRPRNRCGARARLRRPS